MYKFFVFLIVFSVLSVRLFSQEALPDFTLKQGVQNEKVISWKNNYGDQVVVMIIQRSYDSLRDFRTLYAVEKPWLPANAYTDIHPVQGLDYYRIYCQLKNSTYFFTKAKKIVTGYISPDLYSNIGAQFVVIKGDEERTVPLGDFRKITDSVLSNTYDSILYAGDSTVEYKKYNPNQVAVSSPLQNLTPAANSTSSYVYQNPDGAVVLRLPGNKAYNYSMTIYQQDGSSVLYKINHFDNAEIILSKSSFMRTGFYPYELFENGKLVEKNGFTIK